jgi:hypothetical protein
VEDCGTCSCGWLKAFLQRPGLACYLKDFLIFYFGQDSAVWETPFLITETASS